MTFVQATPDSLGLCGPPDFLLAFYVVHEVRDPAQFLRELQAVCTAGATLLVVEPKIHVTRAKVEAEPGLATSCGFTGPMRGNVIRFSWTLELEASRG